MFRFIPGVFFFLKRGAPSISGIRLPLLVVCRCFPPGKKHFLQNKSLGVCSGRFRSLPVVTMGKKNSGGPLISGIRLGLFGAFRWSPGIKTNNTNFYPSISGIRLVLFGVFLWFPPGKNIISWVPPGFVEFVRVFIGPIRWPPGVKTNKNKYFNSGGPRLVRGSLVHSGGPQGENIFLIFHKSLGGPPGFVGFVHGCSVLSGGPQG